MLVIRLARTGRKKYPTYRVVAADSRRPATGKFVTVLGHYNPHTKELVLKKEQIVEFISHGAQPSNSMIRMLEKENVKLPEWAKYHSRNKASKQDTKSEPAVPVAEAAAETAEVPATEGVAEEATKESAEVADNAPDKNLTETAESEQKQEQAAEKTQDAAAEAAVSAEEEAK